MRRARCQTKNAQTTRHRPRRHPDRGHTRQCGGLETDSKMRRDCQPHEQSGGSTRLTDSQDQAPRCRQLPCRHLSSELEPRRHVAQCAEWRCSTRHHDVRRLASETCPGQTKWKSTPMRKRSKLRATLCQCSQVEECRLGHRLRKEQCAWLESDARRMKCRCQGVVGAERASRKHARISERTRLSQEQLQGAHLVAAIHLRRNVVPLDPGVTITRAKFTHHCSE